MQRDLQNSQFYLLNRSRITTSKRYEQKNIHWERAHNGADLSHSIFGLW